MGKLTNLKPRLTPTTQRLTFLPGAADVSDHGGKGAPRAGHNWYSLARWKKLRMEIILRDLYKCQMCGKTTTNTPKLVVDHKRPHRGNERMFWDENNLQVLCKSPCHDKHKQAMEASGRLD